MFYHKKYSLIELLKMRDAITQDPNSFNGGFYNLKPAARLKLNKINQAINYLIRRQK